MKAPAEISTKAARAELAEKIRALAESYGATIRITRPSIWHKNGIDLVIELGPYRCGMDLVPSMWPGAWLAHWYTDDRAAVYPASFAAAARSDVNPYHHAKATTCEDTLTGFLTCLEDGLRSLSH